MIRGKFRVINGGTQMKNEAAYQKDIDIQNHLRGIPVSIFDVADTFLYFEPMTHKKLQKLCYYAQAWFLALHKVPLINSYFEAWIHGPVCPELYYEYKRYGMNPIDKKTSIPESINKNLYVKSFIELIYNTYGRLSAEQLEFLSHSEEPWKRARYGLEDWEPSHAIISNESMMSYYHEKAVKVKNE